MKLGGLSRTAVAAQGDVAVLIFRTILDHPAQVFARSGGSGRAEVHKKGVAAQERAWIHDLVGLAQCRGNFQL